MNGLICSGGSRAYNNVATSSGDIVLPRNPHLKYIRLSNMSDNYVCLAPMQADINGKCPIVFGQGIVLAPKGQPGWFIEFNNTNMFYSDIWAITEESKTANIAVLAGF